MHAVAALCESDTAYMSTTRLSAGEYSSLRIYFEAVDQSLQVLGELGAVRADGKGAPSVLDATELAKASMTPRGSSATAVLLAALATADALWGSDTEASPKRGQ